jgi:hypothetical protein
MYADKDSNDSKGIHEDLEVRGPSIMSDLEITLLTSNFISP